MKKLALASAIAAVTLVSTGAHALTTTGDIVLSTNITVDCAADTPHGGTSIMVYHGLLDVMAGTICLAPAGPGFYPYVLLEIGLYSTTGHAAGTHMTGSGIAIYTDTTAASIGWSYVSTQPGLSINCPGLTGPATVGPVLACSFALLGMPADLYLN